MSTQVNSPSSHQMEDSALLTEYADALAACLDGPPEEGGERLVRTFLRFWEDPQLKPQLVEILGSAFTGGEGAALLRDFVSTQIYARVAKKLKVPPSDLKRVAQIVKVPPLNFNAGAAQVWGVILLRYVLEIEPIASTPVDELVELLAPTIQRYLGGYSLPVSPVK